MIATFSFLYVFVPNTRVQLKPAALRRAVRGRALGRAAASVFTSFVVSVSRYEAIYSGFAIVLVAMLWLYLSWLILLLGAQLAFYLQNPDYLRLGQRTEVMSNGLRERLALSAMLLIARDFDKPGHGWRVESLAARIRIPRHLLEPVIGSLMSADLVTQTSEQRLMPARDPHGINACDILDAVRNADRDPHHAPGGDWNATVQNIHLRVESAIREALGTCSLADMVDQDTRAEAAVAPAAAVSRSRRRTRSHRRTGRRGRRRTANRLTDRVAPLTASSSHAPRVLGHRHIGTVGVGHSSRYRPVGLNASRSSQQRGPGVPSKSAQRHEHPTAIRSVTVRPAAHFRWAARAREEQPTPTIPNAFDVPRARVSPQSRTS